MLMPESRLKTFRCKDCRGCACHTSVDGIRGAIVKGGCCVGCGCPKTPTGFARFGIHLTVIAFSPPARDAARHVLRRLPAARRGAA